MRVAGHEVEVRTIPAARSGRPTIVLLHEGLGCVDLWRDFPDLLAAASGCAVVAWSRWGYGASEPRPTPWPDDYHVGEAGAALPDLISQLQIGDHILWGHSDGATIALLNGGLSPAGGLRGVVSVAGHVVVERVAVEAMASIGDRFHRGDLRRRLARYHGDVDAVFGEWFRIWTDPGFAAWDIRPRIRSATPTLVVQGTDDEYATPGHVDLIVDAVGPPARGVLLDGVGHQPAAEAPDAMVDLTLDFLASLP